MTELKELKELKKDLFLLSNAEKMIVKSTDYVPSGCGTCPENRPIEEYLKYGVVTIDKPSNPSSHEVVTWVKKTLDCEKTGHSGTLDPQVTGVLGICLNRATKLTKSQQNAGKTYIAHIKFNNEITKKEFEKACKALTGHLFQRPPLMCAVKRDLRLRWIYEIKIIEFEPLRALFEVKCEAGTYIRSLCTHIGLFIGCGAVMEGLRRIQSGYINEKECVTLHDLKDAYYVYKKFNEEKYLRKLVKPMESILCHYPRIMIKDTAVNSICYGGQLTAKGVLKFDNEIDTNKLAVLITAKGEAIALVKPLVAGLQLKDIQSGIVTKTKRVIMEKDLYSKCWGIKDEYEIITN